MADTLRDRGEYALLQDIRRLLPPNARAPVAAGDDAAVLAPIRGPLLWTTDALVERVHFRRAWLTPRDLGRRAFAVSASDVAAMGGRPVAALLAVAARPDFPSSDLRAVVAGVRDAARAAGATLAGGNLAAARELSLTVSVVGEAVAKPILRSGGRAGDQLFVTGELGGAALGLRLLQRPRTIRGAVSAVRRWRCPMVRFRAGLALARSRLGTAMIDLSDGILIDLHRLCDASGVGAVVRAQSLPLAPAVRALPRPTALRLALTGGEDYELLFTVPPGRVHDLAKARDTLGCRVTHVGELVARRGIRVVAADGTRLVMPRMLGHQHFGVNR